LPTFRRRSQEANSRRPPWCCKRRRNDCDRMQTSTLSLATSIPATTRSSCVIIQLPSCSVRAQSHALFGLRKNRLSRSRQALMAFEHERAQIQRRAVAINRRSHILADFADTERGISRKPPRRESRIASAEPVCSCAFLFALLHTRPGAARTRLSLRPLFFARVELTQSSGEQPARTRRTCPRRV